MNYAYTHDAERLMMSTARAVRYCTTIGGERHGSSYWWNKLVRYFEKERAVASVVIPCELNLCGARPGTVTFRRDGTLLYFIESFRLMMASGTGRNALPGASREPTANGKNMKKTLTFCHAYNILIA